MKNQTIMELQERIEKLQAENRDLSIQIQQLHKFSDDMGERYSAKVKENAVLRLQLNRIGVSAIRRNL